MEEHPVKRKPGRPSKAKTKEHVSRAGLQTEPSDRRVFVEMQYDQPSQFNKLCKYWKSLSSNVIKFDFREDGLMLFARNFKETSDVGVFCHAHRMNRYYVKQPYSVYINYNNLENILNKVDKSYDMIGFTLTHNKDVVGKKLHLYLQNDANIPEYFEIDVMDDEKLGDMIFNIPKDDYPLQFELPGKYFKKLISDAKNFNKQWTISKIEPGDLKFEVKSQNGEVKGSIIPKNDSIKLRFTPVPNDIFMVSVYVDYIKPTSSSMLSDTIIIRAAKDRDLWLSCEMDDGAIQIDVLVKIVDLRA